MHSHHGSGAVIGSSRKTAFVNFGVSRESGGAVRAPRNSGDKRVKRKRGSRSVSAIAARIERGYLKRTACRTACVNNHGDSRGTRSDGSGHPAAERTSTTARDGDDDTRTRMRKTRTASAEHGEHAKKARAGRSSRHTGNRPVRRGSDEVCGLVVQTEIVPRSCGSAVSRGVDGDRVIVDTKTQRKPRERGKRTQHADVLHSGDDNFRSRVGQVSQCRCERRVRGLETVRDGMRAQTSDEVCGTPDERAGIQIPRRHSNKAGSIRENHTRQREPVHKDRRRRHQVRSNDAGDGGHASERAPHPEQRQNHKLESDARGDSRDHENTTVHRQSTKCQCSSERIRRAKARAKTRPRM